MTIEDYIIFRVNALLHAHDTKIVMRLEGGMSNYTYVVESGGKKYTYRVPGKFAEKFVDREEEWANIQEVNRLGLNNITEYVEIRSGEKLAEYVEGTIMSTTDVVSYNEMSVAALKKIHNSDMKFRDYNAFGRLDADQNYCLETPKNTSTFARSSTTSAPLKSMCPRYPAIATTSPPTSSSAATSCMFWTGSLPA